MSSSSAIDYHRVGPPLSDGVAQSALVRLPTVCTQLILQMMGCTPLLHCARTCRSLYLAAAAPFAWRHHPVRDYFPLTFVQLAHPSLVRSFAPIRISCFRVESVDELDPLQMIGQLHELRIVHAPMEYLEHLFRVGALQHLKRLSLGSRGGTHYRIWRDEYQLVKSFLDPPSLRWISGLSSLERLDLHQATVLGADLRPLLAAPRLHTLTLSGVLNEGYATADFLVLAELPHLTAFAYHPTYMRSTFWRDGEDQNLNAIRHAQHARALFPMLQHERLRRQLRSLTLGSIDFAHLQRLDNAAHNADSLPTIFGGLTALRTLALIHCAGPGEILMAAACAPQLAHIVFHNCCVAQYPTPRVMETFGSLVVSSSLRSISFNAIYGTEARLADLQNQPYVSIHNGDMLHRPEFGDNFALRTGGHDGGVLAAYCPGTRELTCSRRTAHFDCPGLCCTLDL